jgi:hypothetical protein
MYKPSTYLILSIFLAIYFYMRPFLTKLVTKAKPYTNSFEIHAQLNKIKHPMDGVLVCVLVQCGQVIMSLEC